jgi:c-di-GMP-binding flagellar brake protein YcgR
LNQGLHVISKRKFVRYEDPSSVKVKLYEVSGHEDLNGSIIQCHTRDISEGGISLVVTRKLSLKTPVKLRVAIADPPSSFVHQAEVRWIKSAGNSGDYHAGLEFTGSSATHMDEWRRLLRCISGSGKGPPEGVTTTVQGS